MKKILAAVLAAAAVFAACSKNEAVQENPEARVVKFGVTNFYSFETKTAIAASSHVAVYAGAPINVKNADYTVASMPTADPAAAGSLSGSSILWGVEQIGTETNTAFFAMYPYASSDERNAFGEGETLTYTIDASSDSEEYAKDFLVDVVEQNPGTDVENPNTVTFNLEHPFVLLRYVITNASDDAIRKVEIYGVRKAGTIAYETAVATPTGDALEAADAREMIAESVDGNVLTYYSVIMPESSAINPTIKVTTWGGCTSVYQLSAAQAFVAGKKYTASITYSNVHTAVTANRGMSATFEVEDWTAQEVTAGSQTNYDDNSANWPFVKGSGFTGASWDTGLAMSCTGENTFRKVLTMSGDGEFKIYKDGPVWLGVDATDTVDGWTKITLSGVDGKPNIAVAADDGDKCTVYYYTDSAEVWYKVGDEEYTR